MKISEETINKQIELLISDPNGIYFEWELGHGMFEYLGSRELVKSDDRQIPGCLTQIRSNVNHCAFDKNDNILEELTAKIRADERIPKDPVDITPQHFPIFKEYQLMFNEYR